MSKIHLPQFPKDRILPFCSRCGSKVVDKMEKDRHPYTCEQGHPVFISPQLVGVAIVIIEGQVLLTLRGPLVVKPNHWALPGGFVEWGENSADTARRELAEECLDDDPEQIPRYVPTFVGEHVGTTEMSHIMFWRLYWPKHVPFSPGKPDGRETLEIKLFALDDLPEPLAFPYQADFIRASVTMRERLTSRPR